MCSSDLVGDDFGPVVARQERDERLAAALLILAAGVAPLPIATGSSLPIAAIAVSGAHFLDAPSVIAASGIAPGENLLAARMRNAEMGIRALPMIASVQVRAGLPGTIQIDIVERTPLLRWEATLTNHPRWSRRTVPWSTRLLLSSSSACARDARRCWSAGLAKTLLVRAGNRWRT